MLTLYVNQSVQLPSNDQWQNRFTITSATSNRLYIIAQHIKKRHWACSCPGWKAHRRCKHLDAMNLPGQEKPFEVNIINR